MTKVKRKYNLKAIALLLLVGVLALAGISPAFAASSGQSIDISTGEYTKYYMTVPTKGLDVYVPLADKSDIVNGTVGCKAFSRSDVAVTVLLTFPKVSYTDSGSGLTSGVLVSRVSTLNFPAFMSTGCKITFRDNLVINIRESYYNYFQHTDDAGNTFDFSQFKITLLKDRFSAPVFGSIGGVAANNKSVFAGDVSFYSENVSTDPNDPDSPDFELGDNGGVTPVPDDGKSDKSLLRLFYDFLTNIFHWELTYTQFLWIFWSIVGVLGLALVMPLLRRIFGW